MLKKLFHHKLLVSGSALLIGAILAALIIFGMTGDTELVKCYTFLYFEFSLIYELINDNVTLAIYHRKKLNTQLILPNLLVVFALVTAYLSFIGTIMTLRVIAFFATGLLFMGAYASYRFIYLPKIVGIFEVQEDALYHSWRDWAFLLDNGEENATIIDRIVSCQTTTQHRFIGNDWGTRFAEPVIKFTDLDVAKMKDVATQMVTKYHATHEKKN